MPEGRPVDPANWGVVGLFYFGTSVGFFSDERCMFPKPIQ